MPNQRVVRLGEPSRITVALTEGDLEEIVQPTVPRDYDLASRP
jgi:hypothetical protein